MFEQPKAPATPMVHDDGMAHDETKEVDVSKYGYCYEPGAAFRTVPGKKIDTDYDGD